MDYSSYDIDFTEEGRRRVHLFSYLLGYSRRQYLRFVETQDTETLGLAGAIFKRKWEADGKRQNLERSLFYYLKGYTQCLPADAPAEAREDVLGYVREKISRPR